MPIYEYRCVSCGHMFDMRQGFNAPVEAACPLCRSASQRVIQPVGIVFKGSGWHITDYRKASSAALNPSGAKSDESGGGSDATTSPEPAASAAAKPAPAPASSSSSSSSSTE